MKEQGWKIIFVKRFTFYFFPTRARAPNFYFKMKRKGNERGKARERVEQEKIA